MSDTWMPLTGDDCANPARRAWAGRPASWQMFAPDAPVLSLARATLALSPATVAPAIALANRGEAIELEPS